MSLSDKRWLCSNREKDNVSILVLMDESFRRARQNKGGITWHVSILVLMDESFRRQSIGYCKNTKKSFHPCFNGWVFQTVANVSVALAPSTCFHPCFNGWVFQTGSWSAYFLTKMCFHPCFNGWVFQTQQNEQYKDIITDLIKFPSLF